MLIDDATSIIALARRSPTLVGRTMLEAMTVAVRRPYFFCLWENESAKFGCGMLLVCAPAGQSVVGDKLVKHKYSMSSVGAAFVESRAFAEEVKRLVSGAR